MYRPRHAIAATGLAAALVAAPILAAATLAADPAVVVKPGDTLTAISRRHGVEISRIVELNDIRNANRIYVGQRLRLAPATAPAAAKPAAAPSAPAPATHEHVVRAGQTLTSIARTYGVTIRAIAEANRIANPSRIYAGQRLSIPGAAPATPQPASKPAPAPAPAPAAREHVVRAGQTLTSIARTYDVTIGAIVEANRIANPSRIYAGQRLSIPGAPGQAAAPAAAPAAPAPPMPASMAALVAQRDGVRRVITEEAQRFGVPVPFSLAVAWQESGWQQGVVSHAGAVGVMQLLPTTGEWVGEAMLGSSVNLDDLRQNVRAGVRLLAHYLDRYDGNRDLVLAAYYQGQTAADRHGVFGVTRPYIASINVLVTLFGG